MEIEKDGMKRGEVLKKDKATGMGYGNTMSAKR